MSLIDNREINDAQAGFKVSEASAGDFFALLKPRVMSLVVFTAFAGLILAPGTIHPLMASSPSSASRWGRGPPVR